MKLILSDNTSFDINTDEACSALPTIRSMHKHLQHVKIPFKEWDNPYYCTWYSHEDLVGRLAEFGKLLEITVDVNRCLIFDQSYYNQLHQIYEVNYNGDPAWLDYHEHIHICEQRKTNIRSTLTIDYREKVGPLVKRFNQDWAGSLTTTLQAGDVFTRWVELGKTPYGYWCDQEPNDINRICELAKPWDKFTACVCVALTDVNLTNGMDVAGFNQWWEPYQQDWCKHWGIKKWSLQDMRGVLVFGTVDNIELLNYNLMNNISPVRISL